MIKSLFIFLPATLMPKLAAFILSLIGANLLPTQEFGYYALVIVIGEMSEMSAVGWTRVLLIRFGSTQGGGLAASSLRKMSLASCGALCVALFVAITICLIVAPERFSEMAISTCTYIIAFGTLRLGLTTLQIEGLQKTYAVIESVRAPLFITGVAFAMTSTSSFSISTSVGSGLVFSSGLIALIIGWRNSEQSEDTAITWIDLFRSGLPILLISLLSYIIISLDKMIISTSFSKDTIAIYAIAFALGRQGFDVLSNAINVHSFPLLVRTQKQYGNQGARIQTQKTFVILLSTALPAAGALIASRNFIAELILPGIYHEAVRVALPLVAFGAIFMNLKNFCFDNIFHIYDKNYFQIPTLAIGASVSIATALFTPTEEPLISAASIYTFGALASLLSSIIISRRFLTPKTPWILIGLLILWACIVYLSIHILILASLSMVMTCLSIIFITVLSMMASLLFYLGYEKELNVKEALET